MPVILGLVGSVRREKGLTHRVVEAAMQGARSVGAETRVECLADWEVEPCTDCGAPCFEDGVCVLSESVTELTKLVNEADGLVLGAPVYIWQANALTHAFMDRYRVPGNAALGRQPNGRPALAVAVAGGTGTGVSGALRSLLDFLCLWGYRPLEPIAATRYNIEEAVTAARKAGIELATQAENPEPFKDLAALLACYSALPLACHDHVDELVWLAEQAAHLGLGAPAEILGLCAEARQLKVTDPVGAAEKAVHAFELARGAV